MENKSKRRKNYIICFIMQIISILVIGFLPIIIFYYSFHPKTESEQLGGLAVILYIIVGIIHYICAIICTVIFILKIKQSLRKDNCSIAFFVIYICFLFIVLYYTMLALSSDDSVHKDYWKAILLLILLLLLIIAAIVSTIIKIVILCGNEDDDNFKDGAQLMNEKY